SRCCRAVRSFPTRRSSDLNLAHGFAVALTPLNLMWSLVGVTLGTAIGILPGIGPALTIALLLPVTYHLDPTAAFIMFGGLYYGRSEEHTSELQSRENLVCR